MRFDFLSIFPEVFAPYLGASIVARAEKKGLASYGVTNIRDFTDDPHRSVDDAPYGGGAGMVMKVGPIDRAAASVAKPPRPESTRIILLSAKGRLFTQQDAVRLSKFEHIVFVCGRYEGVDERVAEHIADEELSIGEYVLTGGELPALVVSDAIVRLLPGVLGNEESLRQESYSEHVRASHPVYTRPEDYRGWRVPGPLLGGNHKEIESFRKERSQRRAGNQGE